MSDFQRLTVPVDRHTADAARFVRSWMQTPAGADLCAGVRAFDVASLERVAESVARLHVALERLMATAMTANALQAPTDHSAPQHTGQNPRQHTEATGLMGG